MSDPIREAAIEAAARRHTGREHATEVWTDAYRAEVPQLVTPLVDAVLAVAGPAYRAEALRDAAENDDPEFHIEVALGGSDYVHHWLRDRADVEEDADEPYCDDGRTCACQPKADT